MNYLLIKLILLSFLCAAPALWLVEQLINDGLGANPVEALTHTTGDWTIYFLLITLLLSSIQRTKRIIWPLPFHLIRRITGISAFVYALLHLMIYFVFDMGLDITEAIADIVTRPFILIGMLSFFLLIPLVLTSTLHWQKRLKHKWFKLHWWIYPISLLGILHYAMLVKADILWPLVYFAILMTFYFIRLKHHKY